MPRQQPNTSEPVTDSGADRAVYRLDISIPRDSDLFRSIDSARKRADGIPDISFPRQVLEILHEWHNARVRGGNHPVSWQQQLVEPSHPDPDISMATSDSAVPDDSSEEDASDFSVELDPKANPTFTSQWTAE